MLLMRKFLRLGWLMLVPALIVGCAALSPVSPEEAVRERAQARWNALIAGEWSKAYRYMAPSYRALVEEKRYANQFGSGAAWVGAEVVKVACSDDRCAATLKVRFRPMIGGRPGEVIDTHLDETWIREDGQWWMFQKL